MLRSLQTKTSGTWFTAPGVALVASMITAANCGPASNDGAQPLVPTTCAPAGGTCTTDQDCTDYIFCNGRERCQPGAANANACGCAFAEPRTACSSGQSCDEVAQRCVADCGHAPDADGDGHRALDCGGDDCDDADVNRFPGNPESCDNADHDEDCDPLTFAYVLTGDGDADGDGYRSDACCNTGATTVCGDDCDDTEPGVHPGLPEVCNGVDDNCDDQIDEGVKVTLFADADRDGYGVAASSISGCPGTDGYALLDNDCDDSNAAIAPGSLICTGSQGDGIRICGSDGIFQALTCGVQQYCYPQPNGTGICR